MKTENLEDLRDWHLERSKYFAKLGAVVKAGDLSSIIWGGFADDSLMHFNAAGFIDRHLAELKRPDGMVRLNPVDDKEFTDLCRAADAALHPYGLTIEMVTNCTRTPVDIPGEINLEFR